MSSSKNKNRSESKDQRKKRKREKKDSKEKREKHDDSLKSTTTSESEVRKKGDTIIEVHQNSDINDEGDNYQPFQERNVRVFISLPPSALSNIANAMNASMQKLLLKYSNGMGGVLISYRDVEIDDSTPGEAPGRIMDEMPHLHYYMKCTVLIFNPSVGTVVRGKVNESFPSHVGLLVHELFNAMISAELLKKDGFKFDDETYEWRKNTDSVDRVIKVDDGMRLTVDKIHESNGLISLECKDPTFFNEINK